MGGGISEFGRDRKIKKSEHTSGITSPGGKKFDKNP